MSFDVVIVGAGPVGLCLSQACAQLGLKTGLIERQSEAAIADARFDGREIALNHASLRLLRELGIWQHVEQEDISPLRAAKVFNGDSPYALEVESHLRGYDRLGTLVPNYRIRQAAWRAVAGQPSVQMWFDANIASIRTPAEAAEVQLEDGSQLRARLLIAADSRFSETRRTLGISAEQHDFGKTMLVCRMRHALANHGTAWEWFGHRQTLAVLPLHEHISSIVITVTGDESQRLMALSEDEFEIEVERRFGQRLGTMELVSSRHAYPLVSVFARRFVGQRFALAGDAAVGMHPVTAHGFNLGLASVERLRDLLRSAQAGDADPGSAEMLANYQRRHRRGTLPLYLGTRAIIELFTNDIPPAVLFRDVVLRSGQRLPPFRRALAMNLIDDGPVDQTVLRRLGRWLKPRQWRHAAR